MSAYTRMIVEDTGCVLGDAPKIESIMRAFVFHGALDGLTRDELRQGAIKAKEMFGADQSQFNEHFQFAKQVFEQMKNGGRP